MQKVWNFVKANWKTNLAALCAFAFSVPQFVTAITAWQSGQHADWRGAVISLILAGGLAVAKDSTTHSTVDQVNAATFKASPKQ